MLRMYGTMQCPDCQDADRRLKAAGIPFTYINIESLANLKAFLRIRDGHEDVFAPVKGVGAGIPCFEREDGSISLDLDEIIG